MEAVLALLVVVAALVVAVVAWRRASRDRPEGPRPEPWSDEAVAGETVALDLDAADPDDPAVRRLVRETGQQVLRGRPDLDRVRVVGRDGTLLGEIGRPEPLPDDVELPGVLHEPHTVRHRTPGVVEREQPGHPGRGPGEEADDEPLPHRRPFADRFELPQEVEAVVTDRDDPVDVVRAILQAAGHEVEVDRDLLIVGDLAIVLVPDVTDRPTQALNHAFLRCQEARRPRGLVIRLGWVNAEELRHREAAAPWVRHVDGDAIQRMADAVALGADPLAFAVGPRVVRRPLSAP